MKEMNKILTMIFAITLIGLGFYFNSIQAEGGLGFGLSEITYLIPAFFAYLFGFLYITAKQNNYIPLEKYQRYEVELYKKPVENGLTKKFHDIRFRELREVLNNYYEEGMNIIDMCCGLCMWNKEKLEVDGLDINLNTLKIAQVEGRINKAIGLEVMKNEIESDSYDIVINMASLEHMKEPSKTLLEFKRILKEDGLLILEVPYDVPFSLLKILFWLRCFWEGSIYRNEYYLKKGGHLHHFSPRSIRRLLEGIGFEIIELNVIKSLSTIVVAKK